MFAAGEVVKLAGWCIASFLANMFAAGKAEKLVGFLIGWLSGGECCRQKRQSSCFVNQILARIFSVGKKAKPVGDFNSWLLTKTFAAGRIVEFAGWLNCLLDAGCSRR